MQRRLLRADAKGPHAEGVGLVCGALTDQEADGGLAIGVGGAFDAEKLMSGAVGPASECAW